MRSLITLNTTEDLEKITHTPDHVNWSSVWKTFACSEEFIRQNKEHADWNIICARQRLSEAFINEMLSDIMDSALLCTIINYQFVSEEFLEKYIDIIKDTDLWYDICRNQNISPVFIAIYDKMFDKVTWSVISSFQDLSGDFISEHILQLDAVNLAIYQLLSEDLIERIANVAEMSTGGRVIFWNNIVQHQTLSEHFISEHMNSLDWALVSKHQTLSEEFIMNNLDKVDWRNIFKYQKNVSLEFLANNRHRL